LRKKHAFSGPREWVGRDGLTHFEFYVYACNYNELLEINVGNHPATPNIATPFWLFQSIFNAYFGTMVAYATFRQRCDGTFNNGTIPLPPLNRSRTGRIVLRFGLSFAPPVIPVRCEDARTDDLI
jgi:hypothetical protein